MLTADLQATQDQAQLLFGELDQPAFSISNREAVVVEDRMLVWESDGNQWFMVFCPNPGSPHYFVHFGEPVWSRAQVITRSAELQLRLDAIHL